MKRRSVLLGLATMGLVGAGFRYWPEDGFWNPCPDEPLPQSLLDHPLVSTAWEGIDPAQCWDCHVHLIASGDGGSGGWINPQMHSLGHPIQWLQRAFYLNGSCTSDDGRSDRHYVERLVLLQDQLPAGAKLMLLAFDYRYDNAGERRLEASAFHTPDAYAASVVRQASERFEWIASIHPYRHDAVAALRDAVNQGARVVKWLPAAQGMDPGSPPFATPSTKRPLSSMCPCWCRSAPSSPCTLATPRITEIHCACVAPWTMACVSLSLTARPWVAASIWRRPRGL